MRLALDIQATHGQKTGIGHYSANLLAALVRVDSSHEYLPLDWGYDPIMRLDRRLRWQQIELPRRAKAARPDLLHVTGFDAPCWRPCPIVLTVHDLIGALFPAQFPPAARFYWATWLPRSLRWADAIIADSEHTHHDILRLTNVPAERVTVIPLGVESRFCPPLAGEIERIRAAYHLPENFLLYIGTLEPRKGLDTLLDAFAQLASDHSLDLVIVGKQGWATDPLFQQVNRLGLAECIHFSGYVPDGDLPGLYAAAQAFVFPSRYEGFGLPPLEAMACGTPVICSNAASLPEVVGQAALTYPAGDIGALANAIQQVLTNSDLQINLRAMGIEQAGQFTWEATARKTLNVYENLLAH